MTQELGYVLINPYTIAKSRTGGVIARYVARTNLQLVGARMFGPSRELVEAYSALIRSHARDASDPAHLIADYVLSSYMPNPSTGRPRRVMLLLFKGEDAVANIWRATGSATLKSGSGETIRDTYGDYIVSVTGAVQYFEPAVLVAPSRRRAEQTLRLWARYASSDGGMIGGATDVPEGGNAERTLVMLKPDNFRVPSARAGNIIDILSSSGLRITCVRKFSMTVAQAEQFYGPIRETLEQKFAAFGAERAARALTQEFGFDVPRETLAVICREIGPLFARAQFESIVHFMTGYRPARCQPHEKERLGKENCLALVYDGPNAVRKIRSLLGTTDPSKAPPGSVRREFGSDIMVNAAHASDSVENAAREMAIIDVQADDIKPLVDRHYGSPVSRVRAWTDRMPRVGTDWWRRFKDSWKAEAPSTPT
jgi:nucleoside diphosphate kinase